VRQAISLLIVASLLLGGCLGSDDPKADYIAEADGACESYSKRRAALRAEVQRARADRDSAQAIESGGRLYRLGQQEIKAIEKIKPPAEEKAKVDRILATYRDAQAGVKAAIEGVEERDPRKRAAGIREARRKSFQAARQGREFGFKTCLTARR
jgi:hypothetical protein